jgi:hypothetical protein
MDLRGVRGKCEDTFVPNRAGTERIPALGVQLNIKVMSLSAKELQDLLDELETSRASRKRAWENLQENSLGIKGYSRGRASTAC